MQFSTDQRERAVAAALTAFKKTAYAPVPDADYPERAMTNAINAALPYLSQPPRNREQVTQTVERVLHDHFCVCGNDPNSMTHGGHLEAVNPVVDAVLAALCEPAQAVADEALPLSLRPHQMTQDEANQLDALRGKPSPMQGKTFKRIPEEADEATEALIAARRLAMIANALQESVTIKDGRIVATDTPQGMYHVIKSILTQLPQSLNEYSAQECADALTALGKGEK